MIHTVGPVYNNGLRGEPEKLASAYRNSVQLVVDNNLKSVSFPSISTGAYRYPIDKAAEIALSTVINSLEQQSIINEVQFVIFSDSDLDVYRKTLASHRTR